MDRKQLAIFQVVVRHRSISRAAKSLHLSQPAVSKQIASLENHLGVKLFNREPSGMELTSAGETVSRLSNTILKDFEELELSVNHLFTEELTVRIATTSPTAKSLLVPFIASTRSRILDLLIADASEVNALLNRNADLAISTASPPDHLDSLVVANLSVLIQAPAAHPIFSSKSISDADSSISLSAVHNEKIIIPRTGLLPVLSNSITQTGISVIQHQVSSGDIAQALASAENGIAIVTELPRFGLNSKICTIVGKDLTVPLYAAWDPRHFAAPQIKSIAIDFSDWMKDWVAKTHEIG
ncbi:LysR family transcriptional regulator [Corynebacterium stationis]|uniref:LysR family transcriptional regulator n=1 Tax=Corynebacterium stationis TaxID=1705 RepID=UPI00076F8300|nr:LysR family transcriptional regulator [Corynebacterium stationis]AMJ43822.1 hypothetical protein AW169_02035 [Corynebacterium stationis]AQX70274.1 hypothetical protein CA21670_01170 [Corynebacterium stationis]ASJ17972.1 hypothetical protein BA700_02035 [Corynebacterium stationis]HJG65630.1 LysR family transcriptional regulator [Corynebacterium stationis]